LRRRSSPSLVARIRVYWLILLLSTVLATWLGWTLATLPAFHMESLDVSGLSRVSRAEVIARAAIDPDANVWLFDTLAAERRVQAIPYVLSARIRRSLPAHVRVGIVERSPEACVRFAGGAQATVDQTLRVLERGCAQAPLLTYDVRSARGDDPGAFLRDSELAALQADERLLAAAGAPYRRFDHDAFGGLEASLANGIEVLFGDEGDLAPKERLVGSIVAQLGPRLGQVGTIDVRAPSAPVVAYRPKVVHSFSTQYIQGTHRRHHNI